MKFTGGWLVFSMLSFAVACSAFPPVLPSLVPAATVTRQPIAVSVITATWTPAPADTMTASTANSTSPPTQVAIPTRLSTPSAVPTRAPTSTPQTPRIDQFLARCPTEQEVAAINKDLRLTFQADPTAGKLVCTAAAGSADLTLLQRRAYNVLLVMKQLEFSKPLPWTGKRLYDWFVGTIKGIRFRVDIIGGYCCEPKDTINVSVASNTYLVLTDNWIWNGPGTDPRSGGGLRDTLVLFAHEARHNEGYSHDCPLIQNGTPIPNASDKTIAQLGAWGVQYYLQTWLADYSDPNLFPDIYRQNSKYQAEDTRKTRFCNEPK